MKYLIRDLFVAACGVVVMYVFLILVSALQYQPHITSTPIL